LLDLLRLSILGLVNEMLVNEMLVNEIRRNKVVVPSGAAGVTIIRSFLLVRAAGQLSATKQGLT
jgi:hypothetical protein